MPSLPAVQAGPPQLSPSSRPAPPRPAPPRPAPPRPAPRPHLVGPLHLAKRNLALVAIGEGLVERTRLRAGGGGAAGRVSMRKRAGRHASSAARGRERSRLASSVSHGHACQRWPAPAPAPAPASIAAPGPAHGRTPHGSSSRPRHNNLSPHLGLGTEQQRADSPLGAAAARALPQEVVQSPLQRFNRRGAGGGERGGLGQPLASLAGQKRAIPRPAQASSAAAQPATATRLPHPRPAAAGRCCTWRCPLPIQWHRSWAAAKTCSSPSGHPANQPS